MTKTQTDYEVHPLGIHPDERPNRAVIIEAGALGNWDPDRILSTLMWAQDKPYKRTCHIVCPNTRAYEYRQQAFQDGWWAAARDWHNGPTRLYVTSHMGDVTLDIIDEFSPCDSQGIINVNIFGKEFFDSYDHGWEAWCEILANDDLRLSDDFQGDGSIIDHLLNGDFVVETDLEYDGANDANEVLVIQPGEQPGNWFNVRAFAIPRVFDSAGHLP